MAQWFEFHCWNSLCSGVLKTPNTLMEKAVDENGICFHQHSKRTSNVAQIPITLSFRQTIQFCLCCVYSTRKNVRFFWPRSRKVIVELWVCWSVHRFSLDRNMSQQLLSFMVLSWSPNVSFSSFVVRFSNMSGQLSDGLLTWTLLQIFTVPKWCVLMTLVTTLWLFLSHLQSLCRHSCFPDHFTFPIVPP